jgi:hypothetical protein
VVLLLLLLVRQQISFVFFNCACQRLHLNLVLGYLCVFIALSRTSHVLTLIFQVSANF